MLCLRVVAYVVVCVLTYVYTLGTDTDIISFFIAFYIVVVVCKQGLSLILNLSASVIVADQQASRNHLCPCSKHWIYRACHCTWLFTRALGIQIQVFTLVQEVPGTPSHLSSPSTLFFETNSITEKDACGGQRTTLRSHFSLSTMGSGYHWACMAVAFIWWTVHWLSPETSWF